MGASEPEAGLGGEAQSWKSNGVGCFPGTPV